MKPHVRKCDCRNFMPRHNWCSKPWQVKFAVGSVSFGTWAEAIDFAQRIGALRA